MSRALVLGGGGPVGIAWESGLIAGLARAGVDLGRADFILGTSAGSFVGARLALGADAASLADPILAEAERAAAPRRQGPARRPADLSFLMQKMAEAQGSLRNPAEVRAEIGQWALAAETMSEDDFIASFGRSFASLPGDAWPERGYACTAVDAESGAFQLWSKASGVGVTRAVASSCSVPGVYPPVTIEGRRYIDGGMRSGTNADVAAGHELVVLVVVRMAAAAGPAAQGVATRLDEEVASLRAGGAEVVVIGPDETSQQAVGANLMDFRRRPDAVRAGMAQGAREAERLRSLWT
ncbi:MAG TPA: patatin-like phospholipase family protein [Phenylobacterium sp.]|uniref:patatin-like phospholipase family protein n=1 Tax=Phenylobacterium sp. TaxID=1871053 RepID=UPI002C744EEA|nr:patatin-like phospholipase family protein [Phenylobacterium sp.]HSV01617.1 patatin-like phospholipase family protein [Phenylobacterium sp.]